jgi:hypothetical protein
MADKEKIGIVGLGRMGQAMTKHLIGHGYAVLARDIEPKALEAAGGLGADTAKTPAEVGKACQFVIVAVGYDDEASTVMLDKSGLLETMGAGSVIAVSSTCTPEGTVTLTGFTANYCTCAASRVQSNQQLSLFSRRQKLAVLAARVSRSGNANVARSDSRSVNPYGHGPLVYDFSINVTVPSAM